MSATFSVAYGGGGFFGIAYGLGVAHGLRDGGIDLTDAPALGTSAGSWVASAMVLDVGFDQFETMAVPAVPDRRAGLLADTAGVLFGDAHHPNVSAVAVRVRDGRRRILRGDRARLADLCAASSAIPGVFAPHRVGRSLYVDGNVRSGASADLAAPANHLIAIVPLGGAVLFGAGRGLDALLLRREASAWQRSNGGAPTSLIRPNRAIASILGINPNNLFDADRAKQVYRLAGEQGQRWAARIHDATSVAA